MARVCLLNGVHTPGSEAERECPVLRRQRRAERKRNPVSAPISADPLSLPGVPPQGVLQPRAIVVEDQGVSITVERGGRPRKHADARARSREAQRAYRARQKTTLTPPYTGGIREA